jgi:hypothetical protein
MANTKIFGFKKRPLKSEIKANKQLSKGEMKIVIIATISASLEKVA